MIVNESRQASKIRIRKSLERQVLLLRPGDSLPPIRTLMKMYDVSKTRLESILDEFYVKGMIERKPRKGIFRIDSGTSVNFIPYIELVACGISSDILQQGTFTAELIAAFASETSIRHQGMRLHQIWMNDPVSKYEDLASRSDVRACVFFDLQSRELPSIFDSHNVAWVSLYSQANHSDPRCILDSPKMVELQLEHLHQLGHTRIAYLDPVHPDAPLWVHLSRRESFYRFVAQRGARVEPNWVVFGGHDEKSVFSALNQIFSREPYPTALIADDTQLTAIYRFIEGRGLRIGQDFSVIGTDDLAFTSKLHPAATSIRNSRPLAVKMALETLDRVIQGEMPDSLQEIPLELVVRDSTGPVGSK